MFTNITNQSQTMHNLSTCRIFRRHPIYQLALIEWSYREINRERRQTQTTNLSGIMVHTFV